VTPQPETLHPAVVNKCLVWQWFRHHRRPNHVSRRCTLKPWSPVWLFRARKSLWGHSRKVATYDPGRDPPPRQSPDQTRTLIFEYSSPHGCGKIHVCCWSPPRLWHFVMAAPTS
jgi:hypothetical protein